MKWIFFISRPAMRACSLCKDCATVRHHAVLHVLHHLPVGVQFKPVGAQVLHRIVSAGECW
jgi:hypothetical protein